MVLRRLILLLALFVAQDAHAQSLEEADALQAKGYAFFDAYQTDSGFIYMEQASAMFRELGGYDQMVACETELMRQIAFKGKFVESLHLLDSVSSTLTSLGQDTLTTAFGRMHRQASAISAMAGNAAELQFCRRVYNFAHALNGPEGYLFMVSCDNFSPAYFKHDKLDSAFHIINQGIEATKAYKGKHFKERARLYNRRGYLEYNYGDMGSSIASHRQAIDIMLDSLDASNPTMAVFYNQVAFSYYKLGDYPQATFYHNLALEVVQNADRQMTHQWASALKGLGFVAVAKGNYEESIDYMRKTKAKFLEVFNKPEHMFLREPLVVTGRSFSMLGQYDSAMHYFQLALANTDYSFSWDSIMIKTYIANTHFRQGNYEEGYALNTRVIDQFQEKKLEHHFLFGYQYALKARLLSRLGRFDEAEDALADAYRSIHYESGSRDFSQLYTYRELALLLIYHTEVVLRSGKGTEIERYERAIEILEEAAELVRHSRTMTSRDITDYETAERNEDIFTQLIEFNERLYQLTGDESYRAEAFANSERYRANLLLEIARDLEAKEVAGIPAEQVEAEKQLRLEISSRENKLKDVRKPLTQVERAEIGAEILAFKQQHEVLVNQLETDYPDYFNLKYNDKTASIEELKGMLDSTDKVLLEYYLGDTSLYIFMLSADNFSTVTQKLPADFSENLNRYIGLLHEIDVEDRPDYATFSGLSHYLYKVLVAPVQEEISGKNLIILPDNKLYYLPFETLLSAAGEAGNFTTAPYLLKEHAVSYYYSATLLGAAGERPSSSTSDYLGMAPVFNPANDSTLPVAVRSGLSRLDGAQREIKTISGFLGGKRLSGMAASEDNFKKYGGDYNVLHLATHAINNNAHPLNAYLIFSQDEKGVEDGQLHLYELYNMQLDAELAALSACYTGYGEILRGEGVISFAHAFSYANCPNILMSLWAAEDEATAEIVSETFRHLKEGMDKDEALRLAKLSYLEKADPMRANPFFWSAMVLMGESSPISFSEARAGSFKRSPVLLVIGGLLLGLMALWLMRRRNSGASAA